MIDMMPKGAVICWDPIFTCDSNGRHGHQIVPRKCKSPHGPFLWDEHRFIYSYIYNDNVRWNPEDLTYFMEVWDTTNMINHIHPYSNDNVKWKSLQTGMTSQIPFLPARYSSKPAPRGVFCLTWNGGPHRVWVPITNIKNISYTPQKHLETMVELGINKNKSSLLFSENWSTWIVDDRTVLSFRGLLYVENDLC
jgi:hypothetical protein